VGREGGPVDDHDGGETKDSQRGPRGLGRLETRGYKERGVRERAWAEEGSEGEGGRRSRGRGSSTASKVRREGQ